jgi:hypothetical protein
MPTVLRSGPYRFYFYNHEPNDPPHVHVDRDDLSAKFWLPPVELNRFSNRPEPGNPAKSCMFWDNAVCGDPIGSRCYLALNFDFSPKELRRIQRLVI